MKTLKEIAILVKESFNKPTLYPNHKFGGLCDVAKDLNYINQLTTDEYYSFIKTLNDELFRRKKFLLWKI